MNSQQTLTVFSSTIELYGLLICFINQNLENIHIYWVSKLLLNPPHDLEEIE